MKSPSDGKTAFGGRSFASLRMTAAALALILMASSVFGNADLIRDAENLRDGLPVGDTDSKRALTLRLADLIYNETIRISSEEEPSPQNDATLVRYRKRAIGLYREYLTGDGGRYERPYGRAEAIVQFRQARLLADSGEVGRAKAIWLKLAEKEEFPDIACESALWAGENIEIEGTPAALQKALRYYSKALTLARKHDTKVYAHYRRAWIHRNQALR